ncbi:hypothetical protein AB4186_01700 [Vibrio lentus]
MNSIKLGEILEKLEELEKITESPEFAVSIKIVKFLTDNPNQLDLTIVGMRSALKMPPELDQDIVKAAFLLSAYPFEIFEPKYRLYDADFNDIVEVLNHSDYMSATRSNIYIDDEGEEIEGEEFQSRVFPYFVNQCSASIEILNSRREDVR